MKQERDRSFSPDSPPAGQTGRGKKWKNRIYRAARYGLFAAAVAISLRGEPQPPISPLPDTHRLVVLPPSLGGIAISVFSADTQFLGRASEALTFTGVEQTSEENLKSFEAELRTKLNALRAKYKAPQINRRLAVLDKAAWYSSSANTENMVADPSAGPTHAARYDQMYRFIRPDIRDEALAKVGLRPGLVARTGPQANVATMEVEGMIKHLFAENGGVTAIVAWYPLGTTTDQIIAAWEASQPHLQAATDTQMSLAGIMARQAQSQDGLTFYDRFAVTVVLSKENNNHSWKPSSRENLPTPPPADQHFVYLPLIAK